MIWSEKQCDNNVASQCLKTNEAVDFPAEVRLSNGAPSSCHIVGCDTCCMRAQPQYPLDHTQSGSVKSCTHLKENRKYSHAISANALSR